MFNSIAVKLDTGLACVIDGPSPLTPFLHEITPAVIAVNKIIVANFFIDYFLKFDCLFFVCDYLSEHKTILNCRGVYFILYKQVELLYKTKKERQLQVNVTQKMFCGEITCFV